MEKIFTCIKNIGVWHSFEKNETATMFFLKKTFSSCHNYLPTQNISLSNPVKEYVRCNILNKSGVIVEMLFIVAVYQPQL